MTSIFCKNCLVAHEQRHQFFPLNYTFTFPTLVILIIFYIFSDIVAIPPLLLDESRDKIKSTNPLSLIID